MDIKLNRGKIIRNHMGEGLSDLGFVYEKYEGDTWIFARKLGKLTWYVYIYVYRFDPWQITFHLGTDAPGVMQVYADQILKGDWDKGELCGYWAYQDEDSMIKVLEEMVEVIRNEGIAALKKMSVPVKISTDNEMYHELYLHHKEYAADFQERTGLESTGYDEENLTRWFDYIDNRIEELSKGQYDAAAKRELLEMAAFLGEQIIKYKGGEWRHRVTPKIESFCITYKIAISKRKKMDYVINCLSLLVGRYLGNSRKWLEEPFYEVIENAVC